MALVQCDKGHSYDDSKFSGCPYCGVRLSGTVAQDSPTVALPPDDITQALLDLAGEEIKTQNVFSTAFGGEPVTGWLVCMQGPERGRDYRIHPMRNFIGRSSKMDICIVDDPQVSREKHAALVYEPRSRRFLLEPGQGPVVLNGLPLTAAQALQGEDRIEIGVSVYFFIPFCKEGRGWDD